MNTNTTKRNSAITATITHEDDAPVSLTLAFANGQTLVIGAKDISPAIAQQAMFHGLKQKLVDAAAINRNPETGRAVSIEDKYQAVKTVFDRIIGEAGQWNATREGGGATGGLLLQALCRMYEGRKTADELREYLAGKSDAEKTALRKNSRIAAVIEEIRAETGKDSGIDTDELLGELEG